MSKEGNPQWSIRIDEETWSIWEKALKKVRDDQGYSGKSSNSDLLKYIANIVLHGPPEKEFHGAIPKLEQRIPCPYIHPNYDRNEWFCTDSMFGKKVIKVLGIIGKEDELVLIKCEDCIRKQRELENKKIQEILANQTVKNAVKFTKKFMKIAEDGFGAGCFICAAMWYEKDTLLGSRDNKTIECHKRGKRVDIKTVCKETINPSTKAPPCEYFIEFVHSVYFDDIEEFKEVDFEVGPTECSAYRTPECPGVPQCTEDPDALARMNKYCPDRSSPTTVVPLLEEPKEEENQ